MKHYLICENKCLVEGYAKDEINELLKSVAVKDGSISTSKLADNSVTAAKIVDKAITSAKLANNAVTTEKIADNAVTTDKITNGSITHNKLSGTAVLNIDYYMGFGDHSNPAVCGFVPKMVLVFGPEGQFGMLREGEEGDIQYTIHYYNASIDQVDILSGTVGNFAYEEVGFNVPQNSEFTKAGEYHYIAFR